jgi:hypothetical protein
MLISNSIQKGWGAGRLMLRLWKKGKRFIKKDINTLTSNKKLT